VARASAAKEMRGGGGKGYRFREIMAFTPQSKIGSEELTFDSSPQRGALRVRTLPLWGSCRRSRLKPPLCKGRCPRRGRRGCGDRLRIRIRSGRICTACCVNPPVKKSVPKSRFFDSPLYTRVSEAQSVVVNDSPVGCQSHRPGCPQAAFGAVRAPPPAFALPPS